MFEYLQPAMLLFLMFGRSIEVIGGRRRPVRQGGACLSERPRSKMIANTSNSV
jgi:hypothetical protein